MIIMVKRHFQTLLREHLQPDKGRENVLRAEPGSQIENLAVFRAGPQEA
jgi:hypothetical protein